MVRSLILALALMAAFPRVSEAGPVLYPLTFNDGGGFWMNPEILLKQFSHREKQCPQQLTQTSGIRWLPWRLPWKAQKLTIGSVHLLI